MTAASRSLSLLALIGAGALRQMSLAVTAELA